MPQQTPSTTEMELERLLPGIPGVPSLAVTGLQLDSRRLQAGEAFVAMPGEQHDGRNFMADAAAAGAAVIVAEQGLTELQSQAAGGVPVVEVPDLAALVGEMAAAFYRQPADDMLTVGITGTNGKTTTSRVLAQLLRSQLGGCGVMGTLGASLSNSVADAANTTPDAISLQSQLAEWRDQSVPAAVMEVSSHSLVQGRVNGTHFNTAIFTNLTHDHLDYHGDMESYGLAKSLLFRSPGLEAAIINRDDDFAAALERILAPGVQLVEYSLKPGADVYCGAIDYHDSGLEAHIMTPWGDGLIHSPLAGDFNLSNLLAAVSAACLAGMPLNSALEQVALLSGIDGRMEYVPNDLGLQVVVDYAHTPDALANALKALRAHTRGRLYCVFGCGGDRDRDKRPAMGRIASRHADSLILTNDNPRGEDPMAIIDEVKSGIDGAVDIEPDRAAAIHLAIQAAVDGDCVLVAGKGHEDYQQVGEERLPFSDVEQVRLALETRA